ncbi:AbrB/MazE/SpoVT family DNA-binding domain-containing protein [Paenibacillus sp. M1]|uniref:AbrB/MazE/SpoVT family DNA-binding domain-containing protein n=1 Tax=Paenibacillus haidiansis TaxID=1574488 RepID=A0ABU7VZR7_9BACL
MKSTGIVRRIDDLGRVVIPMELRRTLGIAESDPLEIFMQGECIVLRKYQPGCYLCGNVEGHMHDFYGKQVCDKCVEQAARYKNKIKASLKA